MVHVCRNSGASHCWAVFALDIVASLQEAQSFLRSRCLSPGEQITWLSEREKDSIQILKYAATGSLLTSAHTHTHTHTQSATCCLQNAAHALSRTLHILSPEHCTCCLQNTAHTISLRSGQIFSSHLCLCLPVGLLNSCFQPRTLCTSHSHLCMLLMLVQYLPSVVWMSHYLLYWNCTGHMDSAIVQTASRQPFITDVWV
jgi:hypothetical protein